jgi:hypothetical protein
LTFTQYLQAIFPANTKGSVLDEVVGVDVLSAEAREIAAQGLNLPLKSLSNHHEGIGGWLLSDGSLDVNGKDEKRANWNARIFDSFPGDYGVQARANAKEAEGKTVRQLSRLWQYADGAYPDGEGVVTVNAASHLLNHNN